jgi:hypothetical protein
MERHRVGSAEAFGMLVAASQRLNIKLRDIALRVVETDRSPQELAAPAPAHPDPGHGPGRPRAGPGPARGGPGSPPDG